jgi:hypothetical protein
MKRGERLIQQESVLTTRDRVGKNAAYGGWGAYVA